MRSAPRPAPGWPAHAGSNAQAINLTGASTLAEGVTLSQTENQVATGQTITVSPPSGWSTVINVGIGIFTGAISGALAGGTVGGLLTGGAGTAFTAIAGGIAGAVAGGFAGYNATDATSAFTSSLGAGIRAGFVAGVAGAYVAAAALPATAGLLTQMTVAAAAGATAETAVQTYEIGVGSRKSADNFQIAVTAGASAVGPLAAKVMSAVDDGITNLVASFKQQAQGLANATTSETASLNANPPETEPLVTTPEAEAQAANTANDAPPTALVGVPEESAVVTLWKAPQGGRLNAAGELTEGFDPSQYPGDGPYFATDKAIAEGFRDASYGNGLQEVNIPRGIFDELVAKGIIQPDTFYGPGQAWHVPPDGLAEFNAALKMGPPNVYHP